MPAYFLDASGLVKRYVTETGSSWLRQITAPAAYNTLYIARVTGAEVLSALKRREKAGAITPADAHSMVFQFRLEFNAEFRRIDATQEVVEGAMDLIGRHSLRGYDAVHLAAALVTQRLRDAHGHSPLTFVSADRELLAAAAAEGLTTDDPNAHP